MKLLIAVGMVLAAIGCSEREAKGAPEPTTAPKGAQVITLREIADAYKSNAVSAQDRFEGKVWRIAGTVMTVSSLKADSDATLMIVDPNTDMSQRSYPVAAFDFNRSERDRIAALKEGQAVTCEGTFRKESSGDMYRFTGTILTY